MSSVGTHAGYFASISMDNAIAASREDLAHAPGLLRRIVEHAPVLIAVVEGAERRVALANAAVRTLLSGVRPLCGRRVLDVLPPPVGRAAMPFLDDVFASARPTRLREFGTAVDARGTMRYWDATLTPLCGADGVDAVMIMASDVTARVRARHRAEQLAAEAVRRARETEDARRMLDALMAYIPQGIAIADAPEMRVRRVSYHGLAMTKRPWQEILEEIPPERIPERWQIYHLDGRTLARPDEFPLSRAARRGEIVTSEQWLLRQHSGQLVPVLCNAGPIRDNHGRITGAIMSWLNISSLADSRSKLLDAANRFELAIEAGNLGMWDYNLLTGELVWSERCKAITGLGPGSEMNYALFLQAVHPEDRRRTDAAIRGAMDPRGPNPEYATEFRVIRPDGIQRWIAARGRAFFEEIGGTRRAARLIGTFRDITERVQAVAEKEHLLGQKDLLLREMNHRINNSLQIITSLLRLQAEAEPDALRRSLDETRSRVQTVAHVHRRLYQSDRVTTVDMGGYLRHLCTDLARSLGGRYDDRIRVAADHADLPAEAALSLGLIVNELVMNAFKHAYDEPTAAAVDIRFENLHDRFRLTVSDDGRGLPAHFSIDAGGTLGMRVVSGLVEKLGAELRFSQPGRGTSVLVTVPAAAMSRMSFQTSRSP